MGALLVRIPVILAAAAAAVLVGACVTITRTSTGDFDYDKRLSAAFAEILEKSKSAEKDLLSRQAGTVDPKLAAFAQRHFAKANEMVLEHSKKVRKAIPFVTFDDYLEKRGKLLDLTLKLEPTLAVVESPLAFAIAFPSGQVVVSRALAAAFQSADDAYDDVLLGILVHELIHVRDGHAVEQWATADGRNAWVADKALGAIAGLTAVVPFFTLKYDIEYDVAFKSAKELPELSEYAADLGTVALLEAGGLDRSRYIAFLRTAHASSAASNEVAKEPFSWLKGRLGCLERLSDDRFAWDLKGIVIGSPEDGDKIVYTLDFRPVKALADTLDDAAALRKQMRDVEKLSDEEVRAIATRYVEKHLFTACALRTAFPKAKIADAVLTTPGFDLMMFVQYH